jgi:putative SOS response-associated peptidase YedK
MKTQYVTELPFGYDEQTTITLLPNNDIVAAHPVMPAIIYDETVMRWVPIAPEVVDARKTN